MAEVFVVIVLGVDRDELEDWLLDVDLVYGDHGLEVEHFDTFDRADSEIAFLHLHDRLGDGLVLDFQKGLLVGWRVKVAEVFKDTDLMLVQFLALDCESYGGLGKIRVESFELDHLGKGFIHICLTWVPFADQSMLIFG